jgi:hypothetical protein
MWQSGTGRKGLGNPRDDNPQMHETIVMLCVILSLQERRYHNRHLANWPAYRICRENVPVPQFKLTALGRWDLQAAKIQNTYEEEAAILFSFYSEAVREIS